MVKMLVEKYSANYDLEDMFGEVIKFEIVKEY